MIDESYVERGCVSELSSQSQKKCKSDTNTCKYCMGKNCNAKSDFQRCLTGDCIDSKQCGSSEICESYFDECFTYVESNVVERGCLGSANGSESLWCDKVDDCKKCSGQSDCNDQAIFSEYCIVCDSRNQSNCADAPSTSDSEKCSLAVTPLGCFLEIDEGSNVKRGCISDLAADERKKYLENSDTAKVCTGYNCNLKKSFQKCFVCDSNTDPNCLSNNIERIKLCAIYDDQCYTFVNGSRTFRGCLNDLTPDLVNECQKSANNCEICSSDEQQACNNRDLSLHKCIECDSNTNPECCDQPEVLQAGKICSLRKNVKNGCYLKIINDTYERGCIQDLSMPNKKLCLNQSDQTCKICVGKNCNEKRNYQSCYVCNSKHDENCIEITNATKSIVCDDYSSYCLTGVDEFGNTHRGCSSRSSHDFIHGLEICTESNCNDQVFPNERLLCYQCQGNVECNFLNSSLTQNPCTLFAHNEQCFTYFAEGISIK